MVSDELLRTPVGRRPLGCGFFIPCLIAGVSGRSGGSLVSVVLFAPDFVPVILAVMAVQNPARVGPVPACLIAGVCFPMFLPMAAFMPACVLGIVSAAYGIVAAIAWFSMYGSLQGEGNALS